MDATAQSDLITIVDDSTFPAEVEQAQGYILVDMWADWCTPCHMLAPHLDRVAARLKGKLKLVKLNIDENQQTGIKYQVMSLPTLLLFKDGQVAGQSVGFRPEPTIMQWLEERGMDISPVPASEPIMTPAQLNALAVQATSQPPEPTPSTPTVA